MWIILISLVIGIIIGVTGIIPKKYMKLNSKFQQAGVILLLFSMGASIGANKNMISQLQTLGLKSLTFALLTSLFSIIITYFVTRKLFRKDEKE